jgi:hypothetical protein
MFGGVTPELLTTTSMDEFRSLIHKRILVNERASEAATYYLTNQPMLADKIGGYYKTLVADGEYRLFPVIILPGWIPTKPLLLTRESEKELIKFHTNELSMVPLDNVSQPAPLLLPGLNEPFHELKQRMNPEARIFNDICYRLIGITTNNNLILNFSHGTYFGYMDTCDVLGYEFARWLLDNETRCAVPAIGDLPMRGIPERILDFTNRSAAASVDTILIILDYEQGRHVFYIHTRSKKVTEAVGVFHVVPAGSFQPYAVGDAWHPRDFSIVRNVLREFGEEVIGKEEYQTLKTNAVDFESDEEMAPFVEAIRQSKAHIHFLGVGVTPINMRPVIFTSLVFRANPRIRKAIKKFNGNYEGTYNVLPLDDLPKFGEKPYLAASAAACVKLAAKNLKFLISACP